MEDKQPWITCYLTDILLTYVREILHNEDKIDYGALFQGVEGFDTPANPGSFLSDVNNWVPIAVLRQLELQCESISGRKEVAFHAAKTYFTPGRKQLSSLFEIIIQVLNDVRSALIFSNAWAVSQTNYLRLQCFEKPGPHGGLHVLLQFDDNGRPTIGAMNLMKGFCEGFPRIYPFIEEVVCTEEFSQLGLRDIALEFPEYEAVADGDSLVLRRRGLNEPAVTARRVVLEAETVALPPEFMRLLPEAIVVPPQAGQIEVLTSVESAGGRSHGSASSAYRITRPGVLSHGPLTYSFEDGQIFDAPYSRLKFVVKERLAPHLETTPETLRKEVSNLLFEHLQAAKKAQTRIAQMSDEKRRLAVENIRLQREVEREYSFAGLLGRSKQMEELFELIRSIAETDVTVLIEGETGTGKELIARAIHYNGARRHKRFVAINCGALTSTLLESELFGHEKGAFTGAIARKKGIFEAADGGTLFLDEIGEISPGTQVKLLRVLQEGEVQRVGGTDTVKVDVRIIAATNQNLHALVDQGTFRQDLYYRLNVFPLKVPPLRERIDDISLLVPHFIAKCRQLTKKSVQEITAPALSLLMAHGWPGNVRELENTIQRMMVVCKGDRLDVGDIPREIRGSEAHPVRTTQALRGLSRESTELIEKRAIAEALAKTGGNVTHAAKALGVSRATLQTKMKLYDLRNRKF
jgi:DNA-binding NtrC family response regulator